MNARPRASQTPSQSSGLATCPPSSTLRPDASPGREHLKARKKEAPAKISSSFRGQVGGAAETLPSTEEAQSGGNAHQLGQGTHQGLCTSLSKTLYVTSKHQSILQVSCAGQEPKGNTESRCLGLGLELPLSRAWGPAAAFQEEEEARAGSEWGDAYLLGCRWSWSCSAWIFRHWNSS